jgi:hypothetical protein
MPFTRIVLAAANDMPPAVPESGNTFSYAPLLFGIVLLGIGMFFAIRAIRNKNNISKTKLRLAYGFIALCVVIIIVVVGAFAYYGIQSRPENIYARAVEYLNAGDYWRVKNELSSIVSREPIVDTNYPETKFVSDYKDAGAMANYCEGYFYFNQLIEDDWRIVFVLDYFYWADDFRDAEEMLVRTMSLASEYEIDRFLQRHSLDSSFFKNIPK